MGDSHEEARNYERLSIYLFVDCICRNGSSERIRVRNLSKSGLGGQIEGQWAPTKGEKITLEFRDFELIGATVSWVADKNLGIAFDHPIEPSKLLPGLANRRGT